jgi:chromosomal replication initiation ATPase DnaA
MAHNTDIEYLKEQRRDILRRHKNLQDRHADLKKENQSLKREIIMLRSQTKQRAMVMSLGKPDISESIKLYIEAKYSVDLELRRRTGPQVKARFLFFFFCSRYTTLSLKEIGRKVGNYDHTSVLWGRDTIIDNVKNYEIWAKEVHELDQFIFKNIVNDPAEIANFVMSEKIEEAKTEPKQIEIDADSENFYH